MNDMTEAMLDAQYRDQVERWWSPQALSEIHRLLCTVAPLYRETGEHSAIEMSPKEQVSWMCQEVDRLRAELATHCACVFEIASQEGGCDLVEQCKFHASEEENLVRPLRAEIDRLRAAMTIADERLQQAAIKAGDLYMGCDTPDALADTICELRAEVDELKRNLSGVTEECANLLKIKAKLWAEVDRLKAENERIETQAHGIDESLSLLSQQYKTLEAECERLKAERGALLALVRRFLALVRRFREWDHLGNAGDGPYWKIKIDNLIARLQAAARKAGEEPR